MPRYALKIEYDGGPFAGWQRQADQPSVQGAVEAALARLEPGPHRSPPRGARIPVCMPRARSRTATWTRDWDPFRLSEALNYHLKPHPVAIVACARVATTGTRGSRRSSGAICFACSPAARR